MIMVLTAVMVAVMVVVVFLVFICDNGLKGKASEPSSGSPDKNQLKMPILPEHNT